MFGEIQAKLEERSRVLKEILAKSWLKKYARDGLKTASPNRSKEIPKSNKVIESEPINLMGKVVHESLLKLSSRGPSFVPTLNSIDWNNLLLGWLNFK